MATAKSALLVINCTMSGVDSSAMPGDALVFFCLNQHAEVIHGDLHIPCHAYIRTPGYAGFEIFLKNESRRDRDQSGGIAVFGRAKRFHACRRQE